MSKLSLIEAIKANAAAESPLYDIRDLLKAGADVDERSPIDNGTPLTVAAVLADTATIEILLSNGADTTLANKYGTTPLIALATQGDYPDTARLLIAAGAEVDARHEDGGTALHITAQKGSSAMALVLLQSGADRELRNNQGATALDICKKEGGHALSMLLADANCGPPEKPTAGSLYAAIKSYNLADVRALLKQGADVNRKDPDVGNTALHEAAIKGYTGIARALIDGGANINAQNEYQATPLFCTTVHGGAATAALLIDMGADSALPNSEGLTPRDSAVKHEFPKVVTALDEAAARQQRAISAARVLAAHKKAAGRQSALRERARPLRLARGGLAT